MYRKLGGVVILSTAVLLGSQGIALAAPGSSQDSDHAAKPSAPAESGTPPVSEKAAAPSESAVGGSVAIVDVQRAIASCAEGKAAKQKLSELQAAKEKPLREQDAELRKRAAAYDKQKAGQSDSAQEQELELTRAKNDLDRAADEAREDLSIAERKLLGPLLNKIQGLLKDIAKEKRYALILESSDPGVVYHNDAIDITDAVIERLNRTK